jgi:hypothetical protein
VDFLTISIEWAIPRDNKNSFFKILWIEMENYPLIMTMGTQLITVYQSIYRSIHYKLIRRNIDICMFNSFQAKGPLTAPEEGSFFKGAYFPQKLTPKNSIETWYLSVQRPVPFYIFKRSPVCFVYAQRTLWTNGPLYNIALNSLNWRDAKKLCATLMCVQYLVQDLIKSQNLVSS